MSVPEASGPPARRAIERLLKRDRVIAGAGAALLTALAWLYLLAGAGIGMSAWDMTTLAVFPHLHAEPMSMPGMPGMEMGGMTMSGAAWTPGQWSLMVAMWWIMMIAMMVPSAAPTILLYAQVHRRELERARLRDDSGGALAFLSGYLCIWLAFAVAATALHRALEAAGLVSAELMGSQSRWLSGAVLILAGVYQLTPLKHACLTHCRAPASFLVRHWRPGAPVVFRLGALHGAYCVGCCGLLMALLFVGGVMNVVWIAALAILVLIEKTLPAGPWVGRAASALLMAWGVATLLA